jgi:putative oxidoreductase
MTVQSSSPSHTMLSHTDAIAGRLADIVLLIGRILFGWLFLVSAWNKLQNMAGFTSYLTNLKTPMPEISAWLGAIVELVVGIALIVGIGTRYAALLCILFVIVATGLAHRYWEYPPAQVTAQFNNFLKGLALIGGALFLFVSGAGRISIDRLLSKRV